LKPLGNRSATGEIRKLLCYRWDPLLSTPQAWSIALSIEFLQRMVRALEDRVSQQARQIQHYQSRVLNLEHNRRDVYSAPQVFPAVLSHSFIVHPLPPACRLCRQFEHPLLLGGASRRGDRYAGVSTYPQAGAQGRGAPRQATGQFPEFCYATTCWRASLIRAGTKV
jgi:hypothetical protein